MADLDIHYDPITVNVDPSTVEIKGLDDTKNTIVLETPQPLKSETKAEFSYPQPIKTESKVELAISQPIKTESKAELDIKPLIFDQCLTIRLDPLPPTCIQLPYQQHFGLTLFGMELIGFNLAGESRIIVADLPSKPQVVWGGEQDRRQTPASSTWVPSKADGGLRIRLGQ